ncbi:carbohydrate-binding family 9-like protein [Telluribacter humicola]|uniref:carbohydrate-binding family 9-like protein n=1 Tax=Telluribacter humicola TaxID=1720261 RepID=UPI001A956CCA|nr:carbohydrate-binding family 9-like protein [Telluribacter humicola]
MNLKNLVAGLGAALLLVAGITPSAWAASDPDSLLTVRKTPDFEVNGQGTHANWGRTDWFNLTAQRVSGPKMATRAKVLYSEKGMYFLMECEDRKLTATLTEDFADLYKEDVVEVFLWTDQSVPVYLEYELSPLNYELLIMVPNLKGKFFGWRPWHYEGDYKVRHATSVKGGDKQSGAKITSWTAEFFIPFGVMRPIVQAPPTSGTRWRGNLYRIDYDGGMSTWTWQRTRTNFHDYQSYGTLVFE